MKLGLKKARVRVFNQAIVPQACYSAPAIGVAPSTLKSLTSKFAQHLGAKKSWCNTTIIELEAPGRDPTTIVHKNIVSDLGSCVQKL